MEHAPKIPLPALATYGARVHAFCATKQSHKLSNSFFTVSEVSTALKTIKSHLRFFFFIVFRQATFNKKKKKKTKKSKIMKAKMGPRMHRIAPFFQKNFRGSMPPYPPSMASGFLRSHEYTLCFQYCAPPNMESWIRPCCQMGIEPQKVKYYVPSFSSNRQGTKIVWIMQTSTVFKQYISILILYR